MFHYFKWQCGVAEVLDICRKLQFDLTFPHSIDCRVRTALFGVTEAIGCESGSLIAALIVIVTNKRPKTVRSGGLTRNA